MGGQFCNDFAGSDDTAGQDIRGAKRIVASESGNSACSWRQTACRRGKAHDMRLRGTAVASFRATRPSAPTNSRCGVFWCEVRANDGALLQEGFVDDANCDYLVPSLAVDASGNIGLGCTRTSSTEFPSVYVMMHAATDPPNTMSPPVLAAQGTTVFAGNRSNRYGIPWGNYNATCVDPSDPTILWTYQQYATSSVPGQYTTCWVSFRRR